MHTPNWLSILPDNLCLFEESIWTKLEAIRMRFSLSHEDFARAVFRTPSILTRFVIATDLRLIIQGRQNAHERFAMILVLIDKHLRKKEESPGEEMLLIAEATMRADGVQSKFQLIERLLEWQKARGTFYNPNGVLREIESVMSSVKQDAVRKSFGSEVSTDSMRFFDYADEPADWDRLYALTPLDRQETKASLREAPSGNAALGLDLGIANYHEEQIAVILFQWFKSHGLVTTLKRNHFVEMTLHTLALYGLRKPMFVSKQRFVVESVLLNPAIYVTVSGAVELVAKIEGVELCWYGSGKFKQRDAMNQLRSFGLALEEDSFIVIDIQPCFHLLKALLEWPGATP